MNIWKIVILLWLLSQVLLCIGVIGLPRKPITPFGAILVLLECGALAAIVAWEL